ncbi:MAG: stalk domain-containing protein [Candidatus Aquilonibacter sp.]
MKRLSTGILAAFIIACCGLTAVAAPKVSQSQGNTGQTTVAQDQSGSMPPADFGSPPSGTIPILFNDHHVYAKPDTLKQGRVLAALVRGGTVLIPLRSMFEQMGASVSYDAASKTVTVSKPGSEVKVTVGQPQVVINGESRPLDVPPILYHGTVLVPVRVISEGMGAYVQWVPDRQIVVVRYIPPTPPPTAPPTVAPPPPTVAPTPTPAPVKTPYKDLYVSGDYIFSPKVYNEFSPGNTGNGASYQVKAAWEFDAIGLPWMIEGNLQQFQYPHNCAGPTDPQCSVNVIGNNGSTAVPAFTARDSTLDGHLGIKVADPRIYVGVGYLWRNNNYGYPRETAFGFGAEKLPDLNQSFGVYGSVWYYPNAKGSYNGLDLAYNDLMYNIGVDYVLGNSPVFLEAGWTGTSLTNKTNAPSGISANGPFVGLGIKF